MKVDVLVISQNPFVAIKDIDAVYDYDLLVIDTSNKKHQIEKWKMEMVKKEKLYVVEEKGAFVKNV